MQSLSVQMEIMHIEDKPSKCITLVNNNSTLAFKKMWNRHDLSDVTLCCADEQQKLPVHRFLLAACSPYFRTLFQEKSTKGRPDIVLNNVPYNDLLAVMLYMYRGSIVVDDDNLQAFCKLLELFEMKLPTNIIIESGASSEYDEIYSNCFENATDDGLDMKFDEFILDVSEILLNLTATNLLQQTDRLLKLNIFTEEKLNSIINVMLKMVTRIPSIYPTRILAKLAKSVGEADSTKSFNKKLADKLLKIFGNEFTRELPNNCSAIQNLSDRKLSTSFDGATIVYRNTLDRKVNWLQQINDYYSSERCGRLAHFIGDLYTENMIDDSGVFDVIRLIKENHKEDKFDVMIELFYAAGSRLQSVHHEMMNLYVGHLRSLNWSPFSLQICNGVAEIIRLSELNWHSDDDNAYAINRQSKIKENLCGRWYESVLCIEEHIFWIRNTIKQSPSDQFEYHIARNNEAAESRRRIRDQIRMPKKQQKAESKKPK